MGFLPVAGLLYHGICGLSRHFFIFLHIIKNDIFVSFLFYFFFAFCTKVYENRSFFCAECELFFSLSKKRRFPLIFCFLFDMIAITYFFERTAPYGAYALWKECITFPQVPLPCL